jgi:hypothetical protein
MDDPVKLESFTAQAGAWDARQTPRLLSKDVLEFKGFMKNGIRRGERAQPTSATRSLLNCFRYLDRHEKWHFLLGLTESELPTRIASHSQ